MKKWFFCFLVMALCPLCLISCGEEEAISNYNLVIEYDNSSRSLIVAQSIDYVNSSDNSFVELYFHLYPNAFREDAKERPVSLANWQSAYPNGESYGGITITQVLVEGALCEFRIEGEDQNILAIPLFHELFPDEKVKIEMSYEVQLPNVNHRFGYGSYTINIANFYPIACVYVDGVGFAKDLYTANGDPFFSDIANYSVQISYDKDLILSSSGDIYAQKTEGNTIVANILGEKIRDFAMVLSSDFEVESKEINGVVVNYYYYNDESAKSTLSMSANALEFFSEKFGVYPYKQLSVVQSNFVYGGMEYPNLVMISDDLSRESMYYVIAHEIAHQWWYGVVGNDEFNEAWVDESLTEYSTALFFENYSEYGISYDTLVTNANTTFKFFYDIYESVCQKVDTSMGRALDEFDTEPEYIHSVYTQGIIMYDSLRELIGESRFYKCCQTYFEKMAYKNVKGAELIALFSNASGRNLESFFVSYLEGNVLVG